MDLFGQLARFWGRSWQTGPGLGEVQFTVLDTELTGLDDRRDDLVAIGAVRMVGGRLHLGGTFHELVKPGAPLPGRTVVIHGIMPSEVEAKPAIDAVLPAFLDYVGETVLVGHCLALDLAFLNREARRLTGAPLRNPRVDTLSLYGWLRSRLPDHPGFQTPIPELSLFRLAEAFGIPVEAAHSALGDAYVTAQLFQRFLPLLAEAGVTHLASLLRLGDPHRQAQSLHTAAGQAGF